MRAKTSPLAKAALVTTNNDQIDETLRMIRTHGEKAKYSSLMLGTNYRMSEMQAAIGNVQMEKLPSFFSKRRQNAQQLTNILKENNKLVLPYESRDQTTQLVPIHGTPKRRHRNPTQQPNGAIKEKRNRL